MTVGVMSVGWMVLIAALIAAERLLTWPTAARRAVALSLLALALGVALFPADVPGFAEPDGEMHGGGGHGDSMQMMRRIGGIGPRAESRNIHTGG